MSSFSYILKEMAIGALSCLLVVSIVGTAYAPIHHNVRHAEAIPVYDPANHISNIISAIQGTWTAIQTFYLTYKESILDFIVWRLINMVLQRMIRDITNWVRSGFQGEPAFLGNPDQFLTGIADQVVGEYLASTEFGNFICSPFRLEIRGVIDLMYKKTRNEAPVCTFSGAVANVTNFFNQGPNGGFIAGGGWDSWFKVSQNPQNNPYGSVLMAQEKLSLRLTNAKGNSYGKVQNAQGFLSKEECIYIESRRVCQTVTPGSTIEKSLNESLNLGGKRIAIADEVNELIGAFLDQVVSAAFNVGVSPGRGGGAVPANFTGVGSGLAANAAAPAADPIAASLNAEIAYRNAQQVIVNNVTAAETYKQVTYPTMNVTTCVDVGQNTVCTTEVVSPNTCHSGILTGAALTERNTAVSAIADSNTTIARLTEISARYQAAQAAGNAGLAQTILNEYSALSSQTTFHSPPEVQMVEQITTPRVNEAIAAFKAQVDAACFVPINGNII